MANTKLTLSVKGDTVEWAKIYARQNHTSLSKIVQNHLENIKKEISKEGLNERLQNEEIPPEILALTGVLKGKVPENIDIWDAKYEHLKERNGL